MPTGARGEGPIALGMFPALLPTHAGPVAGFVPLRLLQPLVSWQPRPIKLEDRERTEADRMLHR